ncbi:MAG: T9SS type A sorting domain-containing protein, partial [Bacteroidota bacterium]
KNNGLTDTNKVHSIVAEGNNIFLGTEDGVFVSTNFGDKWIKKNNGLLDTNINALLISDDYLLAGTNSGMFRAKISDLLFTGVDDKPLSEKYMLNISPNPASDKVSISFSNAELSAKSIAIYNSLGVEIKRFDESELLGKSSINFTTEGFASGIYYCTISTGADKITKSFAVVR